MVAVLVVVVLVALTTELDSYPQPTPQRVCQLGVLAKGDLLLGGVGDLSSSRGRRGYGCN